MFFRERTTEWHEPKMPRGLAAALIIAVLGVFYFGIFADRVIEMEDGRIKRILRLVRESAAPVGVLAT